MKLRLPLMQTRQHTSDVKSVKVRFRYLERANALSFQWDRAYQRIRLLKTSPNLGRPGYRSGTRELAPTPLPYVVVYAVKAEAVQILHIYHGAQDWR